MRFQDPSSGDDQGFAFNHVEVGVISNEVTEYCHSTSADDLKQVLLLDSGSTVDLIRDKHLVKNIRTSGSTCKINTNGGTVSTNLTGHQDMETSGFIQMH